MARTKEKEEQKTNEPIIRESSLKEKKKSKKVKEDKEERDKEERKKEEEKEKIEEREEKQEEKEVLLAPLEDYIKAGVHLGTKAITPDMRQYVYRRKADGIAVLNTKKIDEKIAIAANFLAQFEPQDILVCCKRDVGHKALEAFKAATGVKIFTRYPAGIITNSNLENFFEPKVVFIVDPWLDKNVLHDAVKIHIPIVALCDTNNMTTNIDVVVPCNNKTAKSIGLIFYLIAKLYLEKKGIKKKINAKDFYELELEEKEKAMKRAVEKRAEELLKKIKKKKEEREEKETTKIEEKIENKEETKETTAST